MAQVAQGRLAGRLAVAVIAAEAVPILVLVAVVALFGPSNQVDATAFAERAGQWVGPIAGSICTFAAAAWVTRARDGWSGATLGLLVGVLVAAIDVALLIAAGAAFQWLFLASNGLRVVAGTIGGARGRRRSHRGAAD